MAVPENLLNPGYKHDDPFDSGFLDVSDIHSIWYEQYGRKGGKPVIFLHGGPGGNISRASTVFFDPSVYHVVLMDQRGAGASTPKAELRENTSQDLVADIESLRKHVRVDKWHVVFGGSWGSTLAILYAQTHPESVSSMVLRGIFTMRDVELEWFFGSSGSVYLHPELREAFLSYLSPEEQTDPLSGYYRLLTSDETPHQTKLAAAKEWARQGLLISSLVVENEAEVMKELDDEEWVLAFSQILVTYFKNGAWLEKDQLVKEENLAKIRGIPTAIINGRYDLVCPPKFAWDLHKALPKSELFWIENAGHSAREPGTHAKLVEVCDRYGQMEWS